MRSVVMRRIEQPLFAAGFGCLALFLWTVGERAWYQRLYSHELRERDASGAAPANYSAAVLRAGPLGRIEIPRTRLSAAILDGVDTGTLDRAVGHVPGTAYPGEGTGRVALAAHRDSFFVNLGALKQGDTIRLTAGRVVREYVVESTDVVKPSQTGVLAPTPDAVLTLITCYPFNFLGSAPERFVVHARLMEHP